MVALIAGTCLLAAILTHAWWRRVRVVNLRQDIFDVRDRLFDSAAELNGFDDLGYRTARDHLNAVASIAQHLTVAMVVYVLSCGVEPRERPRAATPMLEKAIDEAYRACSMLVFNLLFRKTLTGVVTRLLVYSLNLQASIEKRIAESIEQVVRSDVPERIESSKPCGKAALA